MIISGGHQITDIVCTASGIAEVTGEHGLIWTRPPREPHIGEAVHDHVRAVALDNGHVDVKHRFILTAAADITAATDLHYGVHDTFTAVVSDNLHTAAEPRFTLTAAADITAATDLHYGVHDRAFAAII